MIVLTLRTDKPEAELGLYDDSKQLAYETWTAHRQLAETLHRKIETLLAAQGKQWQDIGGIVCFEGPGSFTGLRIGLTVANALAASYGLKIIATQDPAWLESGIRELVAGGGELQVVPFYGADAHITLPKK